MNDFFGWNFEEDLEEFHGMLCPWHQVTLLQFWDRILCPYEDKKQQYSSELKIIRFWIDINWDSITLSPDAIQNTIDYIDSFLSQHKQYLYNWSYLTGHLNWILNILSWAHFTLSKMYRKMSSKNLLFYTVFINCQVCSDLCWLHDILPKLISVHFTDTGWWLDHQADMHIWTDAILFSAILFVYNNNTFVYQIQPSLSISKKLDIFFFEELAILSMIHHAATFSYSPSHLLIYCNNLDTIYAFNSLSVSESIHNALLLATAQIILTSEIDVHVWHINGKDNIQADMTSHLMLKDYAREYPHNRIRSFSPLCELLPM